MSNPISQINVSRDNVSMGASLFRAYQKKEISHQEYLAGNAQLAAEGASQEPISIYLPMPEAVRRYMADRLFNQNSQIDNSLSLKLGEWRYSVYKALDHNTYMQEHFAWALNICDSVGMGTHSEMIRRALKRFEGHRFPAMDYQQAIDVQKNDSSERERLRRGA